MKTLILITAFFLSTLAALAGTTNDDLRKLISKNIAYPSFLKKNAPEKVTVSFKIKEDGSLQVLSVGTDNERLKQYLVDELKDIRVKNSLINTQAVYTMHINFQKK